MFLHDREEIQPSTVKTVYETLLDNGVLGTSRIAMNRLAWKLDYVYTDGPTVNEWLVYRYDRKGIVCRTKFVVDHYVVITDYDGEYVSLWDPYYMDIQDDSVTTVNEPFFRNRIVKKDRFFGEEGNFSLGPLEERDAVVLK
jgi:hypothetical protein